MPCPAAPQFAAPLRQANCTFCSLRSSVAAQPPSTPAAGDGETESVAGYFRKVFRENPRLLKERSNEELYRRWLADHPGHDEVPEKVKANLQNIKSVLRARRGKRKKASQQGAGQGPGATPMTQQAPAKRPPARGLDQLEEQIDECLGVARGLDREGLQEVIGLLREARNVLVRRAAGG
jgi:hypothetical protein